MDEEENAKRMELDALADFHSRLDRCESTDVLLSRRITALEELNRGRYSDDPMAGMGSIVWVMVVLTVAPIVLEMISQWRSQRSSSL